jgi:hypothetical protein
MLIINFRTNSRPVPEARERPKEFKKCDMMIEWENGEMTSRPYKGLKID